MGVSHRTLRKLEAMAADCRRVCREANENGEYLAMPDFDDALDIQGVTIPADEERAARGYWAQVQSE